MHARKLFRGLVALALAAGWACGEPGGGAGQPDPSVDGGAQTQEQTSEDAGVDAGEQPVPDGGTVSFAQHVAPIFNATCTGYCHPGGYSPMSLQPHEALALLVNAEAVGCTDGRVRVAPGDADPAKSYLMAKLTGEELCSGSVMPPSGMLQPAQVDTIRAWIEGGAQP